MSRLEMIACTSAAAVLMALSLAAARPPAPRRTNMNFRLTSTAFANNHDIPSANSCDGAGASPTLRWEGAPSGTRSLALIVHDPDAPSGDFTHWLLWDLPPTISELPSGTYQDAKFPLGGLQGENSFGRLGFGAPCPPPGPPHHYIFTLYALDVPTLGLPAGANRITLERTMRGKILAQAELIGLYKRR